MSEKCLKRGPGSSTNLYVLSAATFSFDGGLNRISSSLCGSAGFSFLLSRSKQGFILIKGGIIVFVNSSQFLGFPLKFSRESSFFK